MLPEDDRTLDEGRGERDAPDPGDPPGVVEVPTGWEPTTDDETEADQ